MAQDTLLWFPAHTLPYRRGKFTTLSTVSAIGRLSKRVSLWLKPLQIFDVDIAAIEMEQAEDDAPSPVHRPPLCIALNDTFYVVLVRGRPCAVRISGLTAR